VYDVAPLHLCFFTTSTNIPLHYASFNAFETAKQDDVVAIIPVSNEKIDAAGTNGK
jgi:hypothetical protein